MSVVGCGADRSNPGCSLKIAPAHAGLTDGDPPGPPRSSIWSAMISESTVEVWGMPGVAAAGMMVKTSGAETVAPRLSVTLNVAG